MNKATAPRFLCLTGKRGETAYSLAFEFPRFTSRNKPDLRPGKTASKIMQNTILSKSDTQNPPSRAVAYHRAGFPRNLRVGIPSMP